MHILCGAARNVLDRQPVQRVIAVVDYLPVALFQGRAVAIGVIAILFVVRRISGARCRECCGLRGVIIGVRPGGGREIPVALPVMTVIGEFRPVAIGIDHIFRLAVLGITVGDFRLVQRRPERLAHLQHLTGDVVDSPGDPVLAVRPIRCGQRAGAGGQAVPGRRIHADRGTLEAADIVIAVLRHAGSHIVRAHEPVPGLAVQRVIGGMGGVIDGEGGVGFPIFGVHSFRLPGSQFSALHLDDISARIIGGAGGQIFEGSAAIGVGRNRAHHASQNVISGAAGIVGWRALCMGGGGGKADAQNSGGDGDGGIAGQELSHGQVPPVPSGWVSEIRRPRLS